MLFWSSFLTVSRVEADIYIKKIKAMKTIKIAIMALALCASVATYAKPKKNVKASNAQTTTVISVHGTVESDGTVKNANGEVIGKFNSDGNMVNTAGQVIGTVEKHVPVYYN